MIYRHETSGRSPKALVVLGAIWLVLIVLIATIDLAWWIAAVIVLCTLPALLDAIRDRRATLEVSTGGIAWVSGLRSGEATGIDHVRLSRRFDGSLKITLIHVGGAQTRLPPDINPPIDAFEPALTQAGIASERHPFSIL